MGLGKGFWIVTVVVTLIAFVAAPPGPVGKNIWPESEDFEGGGCVHLGFLG